MIEFITPDGAKPTDMVPWSFTIRLTYALAQHLKTVAEDIMNEAPAGSELQQSAISYLQQLDDAELIECDHCYTKPLAVDDTRYFTPDGELHEESHPDMSVCLICGREEQPDGSWEYPCEAMTTTKTEPVEPSEATNQEKDKQ